MRVAVVGAGVPGWSRPTSCSAPGTTSTCSRRSAHAGGHANTISVETDAGRWDVDTGFVVLNDRNYPNLDRLFDELGVATQPADMSFSVSDGAGRFEWASRPLGVFARPPTRSTLDFTACSPTSSASTARREALSGSNGDGPSMRDFLAQRRYSPYFVERLIVPQVSSIWSADPAELWSFPASFLAAFFANHGVLQLRGRPRWRSVRAARGATWRPSSGAAGSGSPAARRCVGSSATRPRSTALEDSCERFDELVLAVHSDQALGLLAEPSRAESEVLGAIPYQSNETVLHSDERLLPRRRAARASWNYHLAPEPQGRTTITYDMNRLQSLRAEAGSWSP